MRFYVVMMMMIAPNSCTLKGGKERREVKRVEFEVNADYGGMVQPCCTIYKRGRVGIGYEKFENWGSVFDRNPG